MSNPFDDALRHLLDPNRGFLIDAAIERDLERRQRERERQARSGQLDEIREGDKTLKGFIARHWPTLEPAQVFKWGWALDAMADCFTGVTAGHLRDVLMNVPPGMMKSLMGGVFWPAWEWGPIARPGLRILGGAFKADHAERDTARMKHLVGSDLYQDLYPHVRLEGRGSSDEFKNTATGWRKGRPMASFTGDRGDRVIVDDPHSIEGAESAADRKKTLRVLRETVPTRLNDPEKSATIVIMQRIHEDDVSGMWLAEGIPDAHLMLPMRFEPDRRCAVMIGGKRFEDPRKYEGELLFPERFSAEALARMEAKMTEYAIAGQHQQRPAPREGGLFKRSWFRVVDAVPSGGVEARAWDLAGTEKSQKSADPDYTVGLKGKRISDGQFFITNMERGRWSPGRVATTVKNTATQDGRVCNIRMAQDPGQAGKQQAAFYMTYLAGWPLNIVPVAGSGDKEARARPAAAQAEFGFINIVRGDWNEEFFNEVCSFPASRHDDITDALSDLIDELSNHSTFSYDNVM